jgi:ribonuclease D
VLLELARRTPRTVEDLDAIRGLPRPVKADFGQRIIDAVARGQAARKPPWPQEREREETPGDQFRIDAIWAVTQAYCRSLAIDPALLANRADVADVYDQYTGGQPPADPGAGWSDRVLRDFVHRFLDGDLTLTLRWHQGRLTHGENGAPGG